jgi:hypothetical protein
MKADRSAGRSCDGGAEIAIVDCVPIRRCEPMLPIDGLVSDLE